MHSGSEDGAYAEAIVETISQPLLVLDEDLRVEAANPAFFRQFKVTYAETLSRLIYDLGNRQWDIPELAIRDVTELRNHEFRQNLLTAELQHRVKNILNNVHALAQQTRRRAGSLDDFFNAFEARLHALARSQDLLVRHPTEAIRLREIVDLEMAAVGVEKGAYYSLDGPQVSLTARQALAFAMTVHELVTNAAKYGALGVDGGMIEISWDRGITGRQEYLVFHWREHGAAIEDCDPARGFGSSVIERNVPHLLGGTGKLTFRPDGAECRLEFPLSVGYK